MVRSRAVSSVPFHGIARRVTVIAIAALLGSSGPAAADPTGLVAAWGFDEGSGSQVADASANGNTGSISGATWAQGKFGSALEFSSSGAIVTVNDSASLDLTTGLTLEAWVYPTGGGSWKDVIYKGPNDIYYLEGSSPGGPPATGGTYADPIYGSSALTANTWSHLAATYDGANLRLYVNGNQVESRSQTGTIATSGGALTIGGDALYGQHWAGRIDEIRIYNRALSSSEIQSDMDTPVTGAPDPNPPTAAITLPLDGDTVSHVTAVTVDASDDVGVAYVEVFVDGSSVGSATAAPYTVYWDTTAVANGTHELTAVAHDDGGNQTTSDAVGVTAFNPAFVNEVVVPDITAATTIAFLPDGRMLVGELTMTIWVVQAGANEPDADPFLQLDYSELFGEQGLMDIALDPAFSENGYYYVFYTKGFANSDNRNRVSRFTASGNGTASGSEAVLWQDDVVAEHEHHGGALAFGQDGKLYFTYGDQFIAENSQRLDTYRGKVLRINPDGSIPDDNPFHDGTGSNKDEIWAYGLRNPFRMSIDPATGTMFIADVGGNDASTAFEEINVGVAGANYGWPLGEGESSLTGVTGPIHTYPHSGRDASITGGFVYRGSQFPAEYYGSYFFGDYVQNTIKRLTFDSDGKLSGVVNFWPPDGAPDGSSVGDPVKLIEGPDGSLYYVDLGFNDQHEPNPAAIRRIRYTIGNQPPVAVASADAVSGSPPLTVSFSSDGSYDPEGEDLTYEWDFGDGTSSTDANPEHVYDGEGSYVARLTLSDGVNTTLSADIGIAVGNPPSPTITSPDDGSTFRAGDAIQFSGTATDAEDGSLGASAFSWTIYFHHDGHIHPIAGTPTGETSGTLTIPTTGHDFQDDTSYEILLTVTDSSGLSSTSSVTVLPEKVDLTFDTVPSGLFLEINGIRKQTPFVLDDLIGFQDTVRAPGQALGGVTYGFASWSDGGDQTHVISVPGSDESYVATFEVTGVPGLVAAYGFDEDGGDSVIDSSGNSNDGSIQGATRTASGKHGGALVFDGSGALVTIGDSPSLRLTTAMTLEAWVYRTSTSSGWRDVIYKADDNYYLEGSSSSGPPAMGGTFGSPLYGTSTVEVNTWTHLAATYDGTTARLYVNGVQVGSRGQTGNIETSSNPLQIGGDDAYGQYWIGRIDEVRVYDRALTASEIQADMDTPVGEPPTPDTEAPTAPGSLTANASAGHVDLDWTASTDNMGVTGYSVERQDSGAGSYAVVGTATGTSFSDVGLAGDTTYSYRVRATDAAGNLSAYSDTVDATTPEGTTSGLVAAYSFDEGSGAAAGDASGNGNDGAIDGATWTTSGKYGGALAFDGSALVTIDDSASLRLTTAMTLEAWVYRTSTSGGWRDVIYKADDNYYLEGSSSSGPPAVGGTLSGPVYGAATLAANTWTHLAATYDGANVRLYVNGTQVAVQSQTGSLATSSNPLQIGGDDIYGQYWIGRIDEVRVYDRALSAAEIQTDMGLAIGAE